jgi:hypothetical protein
MRHVAAACLIALAPLAAASAQADLASKIINSPSKPNVYGAKGKLVKDAAMEGGNALRVTVAAKGKNNWASVVETPFVRPIKAGDKIVLMFEARLEAGEDGATTATIPYSGVQMNIAPYTGVVSGKVTIGPEWKLHKVEGTAKQDFPASALKAMIQIGNAKQTIDFGPIVVLNMGQ